MDKAHSVEEIADLAVKSLLYEVGTTPKPGLVDRHNTGAHKDMNIALFIDSALSLKPYFKACIEKGLDFTEKDLARLLTVLRPLGLEGEQAMFKATHGVNTHKGAVFSLGLLCGASGYALGRHLTLNVETICGIAADITRNLKADFQSITKDTAQSHGERLYAFYGMGGIRQEAASGFATVQKFGLPVLQRLIAQGLSLNDSGAITLLYLLAYGEDTNVAARKDIETLQKIQRDLRTYLETHVIEAEDYKAHLETMDKIFTEAWISPGGSADLLALTYFLYLCTHSNTL